MSHRPQRIGKIAQTTTGPKQRRLRVATRGGFDQTPQIGQQRRVRHGQLLASATRPAHPPRRPVAGGVAAQFGQTATDGAAGDTGDARHQGHAAASSRTRLSRPKTTTAPLIQKRIERSVTQFNGSIVNHTRSLKRSSAAPESLTNQNHAEIQLFINRP